LNSIAAQNYINSNAVLNNSHTTAESSSPKQNCLTTPGNGLSNHHFHTTGKMIDESFRSTTSRQTEGVGLSESLAEIIVQGN
jgi:hypothetical protein